MEERTSKIYIPEYKEQILKECFETNNYHAVARKYEIPPSTVFGWVETIKKKSTRQEKKKINQLERQLEDALLENQILKELLKKSNQLWLKD